ncbi:cell division protein SepF [Schaalia sp. Marseille-Q2122]|uniref:cell division protein SepF n=1 Tax=Schaalia sp. Marseille-Q2122 TaxID=2736604 RepID=UPI00158B75FD|nr:cell division protein SepF [Schaalia sp. Marseille-Q2122]
MAGFGAKAREFLGWYTPEDYDPEFFIDEYEADLVDFPTPEESVEPLAPVQHEAAPARRADLSRIVTVHPTSYNDALSIGEAFRDGLPVIVNLSDMPEDEARRIIDFIAGLTFALHGFAERVTNRVFLLSPQSIEVTNDAVNLRRSRSFDQD